MRRKRLNKIVKRKAKHKLFWCMKPPKVSVNALVKVGHKEECACCGSTENLTFDHILPKARGGKDDLKNGQILCKRCNCQKGDRRITLSTLKTEVEEVKNGKNQNQKNERTTQGAAAAGRAGGAF